MNSVFELGQARTEEEKPHDTHDGSRWQHLFRCNGHGCGKQLTDDYLALVPPGSEVGIPNLQGECAGGRIRKPGAYSECSEKPSTLHIRNRRNVINDSRLYVRS